MLGPLGDRWARRISHRASITLVIVLSVLVGAISYASVGYLDRVDTASACARRPVSGTSVLPGAPAVVAAGLAKELFGCAPTVVIANTDRAADVAAAVRDPRRADRQLVTFRQRSVLECGIG